MGRDRIPARLDRGRAGVREARRPLRPPDRPPDGDRDLPRRLHTLRARSEHGRADRVPRTAGDRRRRSDRDDDGSGRRHRATARARQVPGSLRRRLRRLDRDRAAARRLFRRPPLLALDLLHQRAAGPVRARGDRCRVPQSRRARPAPDRLPRRVAARGRAVGDRALHEPRRHHLGVGVGSDHRADGGRRCSPRRVRVRRAACRRADLAARSLPQPHVLGHERDRLRRRVRALRRDHLSAALPPDRQGAQPYRVRAAADADDGRRTRHVDRQRAADQQARALQAVSDRGHGVDDGRDVSALRAQRRDAGLADGGLHAAARVRTRDDDAGARARGPERRPIRAARGRDVRLDALPTGGWLDRRLGPRRDLRQPARRQPPRRAAAGHARSPLRARRS